MANRLSDQEALEFQFEGTPIDPIGVDADARVLRQQLLDAIELDAQLEAARYQKRCDAWPDLPQCDRIPPPLTMEEYQEAIQDIFEGSSVFDQLLEGFEDIEPGILVDPIEDFQPVEYFEPPMNALVPTLIITFVIAAALLFLRDGIRRLLGRPKQRTGKWGIF